MKILLTADLHYSLRQWDWLQEVAGRFDVVVIAGDLLDIGSIVPLEAQGIVSRKYLEQISARGPLLVCSGNHDLMEDGGGRRGATWLRELRTSNLFTDGASLRMDGLFFSILPWWDDKASRDETEALLGRHRDERGDDRWIWVTHAPPARSSTAWTGRKDGGDAATRTWIEKLRPEMVLTGHIHYAPFHADGSWIDRVGETWVINSGRQSGPAPAFTVIDTDTREATWVAAGEAERANLSPPLVRRPLAEA